VLLLECSSSAWDGMLNKFCHSALISFLSGIILYGSWCIAYMLDDLWAMYVKD